MRKALGNQSQRSPQALLLLFTRRELYRSVTSGEAERPQLLQEGVAVASHPYISGAGNIAQMIAYLRKNFPTVVTSETVKKFGLAPQNESYVINALQFIGIIDQEGKRTDPGHDVFVLGDDEFPKAFEGLVRAAYKDLFDLRGDDAWTMTRTQLTAYFRTADKTSEAIGGRQANVFIVFRNLAGHEQPAETVTVKANKAKPAKASPAKAKTGSTTSIKSPTTKVNGGGGGGGDARRDMALTVRIEINLPAGGSKETYDNIFKSIRANLIDE